MRHYRGWLLIALFLLVLAEITWSWRKDKHVYNVKETFANLAILAGFHLSKLLFAGYQLAILGWTSDLRLIQLPANAWTLAVGQLGPVEGVLDTPSAHRVHHGSNAIYIDKNFGGVLMVWDRLFGTYQPETEKVRYGITTGHVSYNPFKLVFKGFIDLVTNKMKYKG